MVLTTSRAADEFFGEKIGDVLQVGRGGKCPADSHL
jgi:hypothetical protein